MSLADRLARLEPLVREVSRDLGVLTEVPLEELVRAHGGRQGAEIAAAPDEVRSEALARLYELRAQHLDWTYETGYLGFFAENPGTRYTFLRRLEEQLDLLTPDPRGALLDVGCGAGILAVLAAAGFARVAGTDVSRTALRFGARLAERAGATNIVFAEGDAERLPFPDGAFPRVVCGEVIGHVADPARAARELARVTSPGGILLLSTPCALSPTHAALRLAGRLRPGLQVHRERQVDRRVEGKLKELGEAVDPSALLRVKKRFRYGEVVALMASAGFRRRRARGATLDLPPATLIYHALPAWSLGVLRGTERALNRARVLPRALSVTTVFEFEKPHEGRETRG